MKKFILDISLLLILIIIPMYTLYNLNQTKLIRNIFDIHKKLDIINLGPSHGRNFDYSQLSLNGKSFNKDSNTLYYDLQNYKYLKKHLKDSAIIILPISYFSFGVDENRTDKGDNSFVNDFYQYLPKESIHSYSKEKANSLKIFRIQKNFKTIFKEKLLSKKQKFDQLPKDSILHLKKLKNHALRSSKFHQKAVTYAKSDKNINYLSTLIKDAKKVGYKPILVTTPFYDEYYSNFNTQWLHDEFYKHIFFISKKFDIPYLDYSHHSEFYLNPMIFSDSHHLNRAGKAKFNSLFFKDLENLGFINKDE